MGNLSAESGEQNRKDKVTRFRSVTYAGQLGLLVNNLGSHLKLRTTDKFCSLLCNRVYFDGFICLRAGTCGNSVKLFVLHRYCSMFWSKNSSRMDRRRRGINKALSSHEQVPVNFCTKYISSVLRLTCCFHGIFCWSVFEITMKMKKKKKKLQPAMYLPSFSGCRWGVKILILSD